MLKELKKYLLQEIETSDYDTICEDYSISWEISHENEREGKDIKLSREKCVEATIEEFLDYMNIGEAELKEAIEKETYFYDDKMDAVHEWADGEVDIYTYTLWKKGECFSWETEEAIEEFGFDKERGMSGVLMTGQYKFWSDLGYNFLTAVDEWVKLAQDQKE